MILKSGDIELRIPTYDDIDDLCAVKNNINASKMLGQGCIRNYTKEDIRQWIDYHNNKECEDLYVINIISESKVIGHVALYDIDSVIGKAEFGILIGDPQYWGRGYGKLCTQFMLDKGFNHYSLNKIVLSTLIYNTKAIGLYRSLGFVYQGILEQEQMRDGKYVDLVLMAKFASK